MRISVWEEGRKAMVDSFLFNDDKERSESTDKSGRCEIWSTKQHSRRFSGPQQTRTRLLTGWQLKPLFQLPKILVKKN